VDGAQQIDEGSGMSARENRAMARGGAKKDPKQPPKLKNSWGFLVKSHSLKNNGPITHLTVNYSDLP
jgi:hypothetical protein